MSSMIMTENKEESDKVSAKSEDSEENENKNNNKINDLIHTMQPVLRVENFFGIFRFRITAEELLPTNKKMKLISILMTVGYIAIFSFLLKLPAAITGTGKLVDTVDEVPSIVILIQYVTSAITTCFLLTNNSINIFTAFANIDSALHINTSEDFYKNARKRSVRYLGAFTVYHFFVTPSDLSTDEEITFSKLIVMPLYYEENLEILVFCLMINMLKCRLTVINNYLAKFIDEKENTRAAVFVVGERKTNADNCFNLIGRMSTKNMKIRDLAATYDIIGETCSLINQVFNYQIFMTLVSTFTYIVITIWSSLYYFRSNEAISGSMITIIIWCITAILKVAVMSLVCERLLLTRNDTKILVNKVIMDYDLPKTMRVQAKAFMDLIEAWPLRVFIYDMFSVDITLMLKYISVATTYLIVIIQVSHFA